MVIIFKIVTMKLFLSQDKLFIRLLFVFVIVEGVVERVIVSASALSLRSLDVNVLGLVLNV